MNFVLQIIQLLLQLLSYPSDFTSGRSLLLTSYWLLILPILILSLLLLLGALLLSSLFLVSLLSFEQLFSLLGLFSNQL